MAFHRLDQSGAVDRPSAVEGFFMLDILMLALGLGFVAISIGYAYACERL